MSATAATSPDVPALPGGADFSDWLSPILVKELRQGLKSRVFVSSFIVMQVVMILNIGLRLLDQAGQDGARSTGMYDGIFWSLLWLPLVVIMPARGLGAVSEEARANTFDLVQLTRLTAFRIALGKWIALVAQTLLLVAALLPYAVLRYYFGGVDVVGDLLIIAHLLMASMVLTAGAVALSAAPLAVRILVLMGALPMMTMMMGTMAMVRVFGGPSGFIFASATGYGGPGWWLLPCMTVLYVFMFLEFAAAKFAPPSENHPARKRTAALVLAGILMLAAALGGLPWFGGLLFFFVPLMGWVAVEALTEQSIALPAIYAPFARRGPVARLLGRFLYPGWATAVLFAALMIALMAGAFELLPASVSAGPRMEPELWVVWPMLFFALISPLPLMFLFPRVKQRFWLYVLIQLLFGLFYAAASIAEDTSMGRNPDACRWLAPFPTSALLALLSHQNNADLMQFLAAATRWCGVALVLFLSFHMVREFRAISHLERVALGYEPEEKE